MNTRKIAPSRPYLARLTLWSAGLFCASNVLHAADSNVGGGYLDAGIDGEYFANTDLSGTPAFTRHDVRIDFDWGSVRKPGGSISPHFASVGSDNYSVRWTGKLAARFGELYTIKAVADDGVRVFIKRPTDTNWTTLIDQWTTSGTHTATFQFDAGAPYDFKVEYRELTGTARISLFWSSPSTPEEPIDVASTLGNVGPTSSLVSADMVLSASNWGYVSSSVKRTTDLSFDANGMPEDDFNFKLQPGHYRVLPGTYLMRFKGRADVRINLASGCRFYSEDGSIDYGDRLTSSTDGEGYSAATNTTVARVMIPAGQNNPWPAFEKTDRDGNFGADLAADKDGVSELIFLRPTTYGGNQLHQPGEIFSRLGIETWRRFTANRWNDVNYSLVDTSWAARRPYKYDGKKYEGVNHEFKVLWCNETGTDLWIQVPHNVDDTYVAKLAQLIRYGSQANGEPYTSHVADPVYPGLNPNLRVYVEFSNELPWNTAGQYPQSPGITNQAKKEIDDGTAIGAMLNYDGAAYVNGTYQSFVMAKRYLAVRIKQISDVFRQVYGDAYMPGTSVTPQVRPVLMYQYNNINETARDTLTFLDNYFNNADGRANGVPDPRPVNHILWGGGGACYYASDKRTGVVENFAWPGADMESPAVPAGTASVAPAGGPWTFTGNAGLYANAARQPGALGTLGATTNIADGYNYRGFKFTTGSSPVAVYAYGRYQTGSITGNTVFEIWDATTNTKVIGRDIPMSGTTAGQFAWVKAGTYLSFTIEEKNRPVILEPNRSYYAVAVETGNHADDSTQLTPPAGITIDGSVKFKVASGVVDAVVGATANRTFGPVNLQIATLPVTNTAQTVNLGFPYDGHDGSQGLFLAGTSSASVQLALPAAGNYAIRYRLAQIRDDLDRDADGNREEQWSNGLVVEILDGANVVTVTPASRSDIYPSLTGSSHGDFGRKTDTFHPWGSTVFSVDSARTVTLRFRGTSAEAYKVVFLDGLELCSTAVFANSTIPYSGSATGEQGTAAWEQDKLNEWKYAQAYGLAAAVYESGWYPGGDWDKLPIQIWFALYDDKIREKEIQVQRFIQQVGVRLMMDYTGTEFGMPTYAVADHLSLMRPIAWDAVNTTLPFEDTNGDAPGLLGLDKIRWSHWATASTGTLSRHGGLLTWHVIAPASGTYYVQADTSRKADYTLYVDGSKPAAVGRRTDQFASAYGSVYLTKGLHVFRLQSQDTEAFSTTGIRVVTQAELPAPTANAGADIVQTDGPGSIQLNGSGSGFAPTISWTQLSGPTVVITGANTLTPSIPSTTPGTYLFRLTITTAAGTTTDDVQVRITGGDVPAQVFADHDRNAIAGQPVTLNGAANDIEGDSMTYAWTQISGPAVTLTGADTTTATFTPSAAGTYVFRLTVTSGGTTRYDEVTITVPAASASTLYWGGGTGTPSATIATNANDTNFATALNGTWSATTTNWNSAVASTSGYQAWASDAIAGFYSAKTTSGGSPDVALAGDFTAAGLRIEFPNAATNQAFDLVSDSSANRTLTLGDTTTIRLLAGSSTNTLGFRRAGFVSGRGGVLLGGTSGFILEGLNAAGDTASSSPALTVESASLSGPVRVNSGSLIIGSTSTGATGMNAASSYTLSGNNASLRLNYNAAADNRLGDAADLVFKNATASFVVGSDTVAPTETIRLLSLEGSGLFSSNFGRTSHTAAPLTLALTLGLDRGDNEHGVLVISNGTSTGTQLGGLGVTTGNGFALTGHGIPASTFVPWGMNYGRGLATNGATTSTTFTGFLATDASGNLRVLAATAGNANLSDASWQSYGASSDIALDNATLSGLLAGPLTARSLGVSVAATGTFSLNGNTATLQALAYGDNSGGRSLTFGTADAARGSLTSSAGKLYLLHRRQNTSAASTLTINAAITGSMDVIFGGPNGQFSLGTANTYTGKTYVNAGRLTLSGTTGQLSATSEINLSEGSSLVLTGGDRTFGQSSAQTIAGGGELDLGNRTLTLGAQARLAPGDVDANDTLRLKLTTGKLAFANGATLALDLDSAGVSDALAFATAGDWLAGSGQGVLALTLAPGFDYTRSYVIARNVTTAGFTFAAVTGYDSGNYVAQVGRSGNDLALSFAPRAKAAPYVIDPALATVTAGNAFNVTLAADNIEGAANWSLLTGTLPAGVTLAADGTLSGTPAIGSQGNYAFTAHVTDSATNLSGSRALLLVVEPAGPPPQVFADHDRAGTTGQGVSLNGSASVSPGSIQSYQWTQTGGPSVNLVGANTANASFTPAIAGTYTFTLLATTAAGVSQTDTVTVTVTAPAPLRYWGGGTATPTATIATSANDTNFATALAGTWNATTTNWNALLASTSGYEAWTPGAIAGFHSAKTTSGGSPDVALASDQAVAGLRAEFTSAGTNQQFDLVSDTATDRTITLGDNAVIRVQANGSSNQLALRRAGHVAGRGAALLGGSSGFAFDGVGSDGLNPNSSATLIVESAPVSGPVRVNSGALIVGSNSAGATGLPAASSLTSFGNIASIRLNYATSTDDRLGNNADVILKNSALSLAVTSDTLVPAETVGVLSLEGSGLVTTNLARSTHTGAPASLVLSSGLDRGDNGRGVLVATNNTSTTGGLGVTGNGLVLAGHGLAANTFVPWGLHYGRGLTTAGATTSVTSTGFLATDASGNLRVAASTTGNASLSDASWQSHTSNTDVALDNVTLTGALANHVTARSVAVSVAANGTFALAGRTVTVQALGFGDNAGRNLTFGTNDANRGALTSTAAELYLLHRRQNSASASALIVNAAITGSMDVVFGGPNAQFQLATANTYTGKTFINAGRVALNGTTGQLSATPEINLSEGSVLALGGDRTFGATTSQTFSGGGTIELTTRTLALGAQAILAPGDTDANDTLKFTATTGKLSFATGSTLALDLNAPNASDALAFATAGDWLLGSGNATLALTLGAGFDYAKTYVLVRNVTTTGFTFANITGYDNVAYIAHVGLVGTDLVLSFAPRN